MTQGDTSVVEVIETQWGAKMEKPIVRVLIFIGSLRSGGKERRLIELLTYLKNRDHYEILVVLTKSSIEYPAFHQLNIPYRVIGGKGKKGKLFVASDFYKVCKSFKPDIIHTWGKMQTFYAIPSAVGQKIPLINSQITAAPPKQSRLSSSFIINNINFVFSKFILSNSMAGIEALHPPLKKSKVIYNGVNLHRFENLKSKDHVKEKYRVATPYLILMAASFTKNKDYDTFLRVAKIVTARRKDISFIGVGSCDGDDSYYSRMVKLSEGNNQIHFPGRSNDIEGLINASDIGVLFTNDQLHGEGISNAILEYMSLAKPVIANNAGGTKEIVRHNYNGYLLDGQSDDRIATMIEELIDDVQKRDGFGKAGRKIIEDSFALERMGKAFEEVYHEAMR